MAGISINKERCTLCGECIAACPFGAMEKNGDGDCIEINAACKLCKICVKQCPVGAVEVEEAALPAFDKTAWRNALVFVEISAGIIHPVTYELIGKARELMETVHQKVSCVLIGEGAGQCAGALLDYGLDQVLIYDDPKYRYFIADTFADAFEDAICELHPSVVLVGATAVGRSLAPRLSTRFRTGLTADCTALEMKPNGDLVQIRPAFGGDIMAQIITPNTRPQFATVRYKTMDKATPVSVSGGDVYSDSSDDSSVSGSKILRCDPPKTDGRIEVYEYLLKPIVENISEAEVIVAGGRGLKQKGDYDLIRDLAKALGGQYACTRPLVESGWLPYTRQIGLSGRTVKPRLIITCGISGAVQFTACMKESDLIIAINQDRTAPIFRIAHYGIVGDLYQIVPRLTARIKGEVAL